MSKQSISQNDDDDDDDNWRFNIPRSSASSRSSAGPQVFEKDLIDFESQLDLHSNSANAGKLNFNFSPPTTFMSTESSLNIPFVATSQSNAESDATDESSESTSDTDSIIEVDLDTLRLLQAKIDAEKASNMGPSIQRGTTISSIGLNSCIPTYEGGLNETKVPSSIAYSEFETLSKLEKPASSAKRRRKPHLVSLPIERCKDEIVQMVRSSQIIVLSGSTGCGKSTQVPQYILDDCLSRREHVNIICTQPRRIAATSIAHRVATERRGRLGDQVGYHIGGHIGYTEDRTRLRYVTTGILLEILKGDRYLERYSHVIMDEIHERNVDDDLMMAHMCTIMQKNRRIKLIVMSATMNVLKFAEYFSYLTPDLVSPLFAFPYSEPFVVPFAVPTIDIPSRCFPVDTFYLEDVCDGLELDEAQRSIVLSESRRPGMYAERRDAMLGWIEFCHLAQPPGNAFLVFLPGIAVIAEVEEQLLWLDNHQREMALANGKTPPPTMHTIKLHSTVTIDEQALAIRPAPAGSRKIVLATNIAESSITVPDIQIVFDSCLRKDVHYDAESRCFSLNEAWVSRDCGEQRRGRAGRTGPGVIYRFVPRAFYDDLPSERIPEILRTPLDTLLLRCIDARLGDPKEILSRCIDPPEDASVDVALEDLVGIGAVMIREVAAPAEDDDDMWVRSKPVVYEYEVTTLGRVLARLPLGLYAGLLVVYGILYGQSHEAMIMAAILQNKGIIVQPAGQDISIAATLKRFHVNFPTDQPIRGGSDLISHLRAYLYWEETTQNDPSFDLATELQWCQAQYLSLYWIREVQDLVLSVKESLSRHGICAPPTKTERNRIRSNRVVRVRPAMLEVGPDALDNTEQIGYDVDGEDAHKEEEGKAVGFTEYDKTSIQNAIEILDKAAGENSTVLSTPGFSTPESMAIQPVTTTGFTKSLLSIHNSSVNELSAETHSVLNPWMNMFDRAHKITAQTIQLQREPNALCLALLLTAAFHHNMLRVTSSNNNSIFRNCPSEFDRQRTIEFTAMHLPPKDVMMKALQREIGFVAKMDYVHSDEPGEEDACYVEFIKPAKLIWNHSRDCKDELPDALYIAQKMKIARNATWDNLAEHNSTTSQQQQLRFLSISGVPRTATKLTPIFSSSQTRTFLPRSSLFSPIISPKRDHHRYTVSAARLLAVDRGRSWVAEYATCLISPLPSSKLITNDDVELTCSNIGDLVIALFGNDVNMFGGWSIGVRGQSYPLFNHVPPKSVERVLKAVRSYNHRTLFEWLPLLPEITVVNAFDEVDVFGIQSLTDVAQTWETMKLKPQVAGDLLVKTVLMSL